MGDISIPTDQPAQAVNITNRSGAGGGEDDLAKKKIGSKENPFADLPENKLPNIAGKSAELYYEKNNSKGYWKLQIKFNSQLALTPGHKLRQQISEYQSLIKIIDHAAKSDNEIKLTIRQSDNTIICFNETYDSARRGLVEKYRKLLLDHKISDNNRLPNSGNLNLELAYRVVEKHLLGSDPTTGDEFFGYRYWSAKGSYTPLKIPTGRILYCNWTLDEEIANRDSIANENPQQAKVVEVRPQEDYLEEPKGSEPKQPKRKDLERAAAKAKEEVRAQKQKQVDTVRGEYSEKLEIRLKDWKDIPEFHGKSLKYKNPDGEEITVNPRNFSHPEDHSIISVGLPYIAIEEGKFFLRFAATPSARDSSKPPKKEFERIIREYLNSEKAKEIDLTSSKVEEDPGPGDISPPWPEDLVNELSTTSGIDESDQIELRAKMLEVANVRDLFSTSIQWSFQHADDYPLIDDEGCIKLLIKGEINTFEPIEFTHPEDSEIKVTGFPYLTHERASGHRIWYADSLATARERHLPREIFNQILYHYAYSQIPKTTFEQLTEIDPGIVANLDPVSGLPKRLNNGVLQLDSTTTINSIEVESCGLTIRLFPSLVAVQKGNDVRLYARYSRRSHIHEISADDFITAIDDAKLRIARIFGDDLDGDKILKPIPIKENNGANEQPEKRGIVKFKAVSDEIFIPISESDPDSYKKMTEELFKILERIPEDKNENFLGSIFDYFLNEDGEDSLYSFIRQAMKSEKSIYMANSTKQRHLADLERDKDLAWKDPVRVIKAYAADAFLDFIESNFKGYVDTGNTKEYRGFLKSKEKATPWLYEGFDQDLRKTFKIMTDIVTAMLRKSKTN